ncbi:MAG: hypothetical protein IT454_17575 [Planctomycetes bacterium]|nr:hypothetical protein [Planctomycetota bacterium]
MSSLPDRGATSARAEPSPSPVQQHVDEVSRLLDDLGVAGEVREHCRAWAESSMRQLAMPESDSQGIARPERALDEMLGVASRALKHVLSTHLTPTSGLSDLQHLFEAVEIASSVSPNDHSIESVVEVVRRAALDVRRELALGREAMFDAQNHVEGDHEWSIDTLREAVDSLPRTEGPLPSADATDRSAVIAVALQIVLASDAPSAELRASTLELLRRAASDAERSVLTSALRGWSESELRRHFDVTLQRLTSLCGEADERVWIDAVLRACESGEPEHVEPFWPHLAQRLVCGAPWKEPHLRERTIAQLARCPRHRLPAVAQRLGELPAIIAGRLATSFADQYDDSLAALYAMLVRMRHSDVYASALLAMVRRRTLQWPGALAFRVIDALGPSARALLASLFERGTLDDPSPETRVMAARLLAQRILDLPREGRAASWVVPGLEALGDIACDESRAALDHVIGERRLGLVPAWPAEHRRAAQAARNRLGSARRAEPPEDRP